MYVHVFVCVPGLFISKATERHRRHVDSVLRPGTPVEVFIIAATSSKSIGALPIASNVRSNRLALCVRALRHKHCKEVIRLVITAKSANCCFPLNWSHFQEGSLQTSQNHVQILFEDSQTAITAATTPGKEHSHVRNTAVGFKCGFGILCNGNDQVITWV